MFRALRQRLRRYYSTGARGERIARHHLRTKRYRILGRNLRNAYGEVDILAQSPDGRTIVVVEVKAHTNAQFPGELHVNRDKRHKLTALAAQLARRYGLTDRPIRFDVVGVHLPQKGKPIVRHHEGAFQATV